jgi:TRAP-type uncharacterized transport system substrate-binding protein
MGCDFIAPQRTFRLAYPKSDYFYNLIANQLKPTFAAGGYKIETIETNTGIEANRLVAEGKADLTLVFNHSIIMANELGPEAAKLRTIVPLVSSALFAFSRNPIPEGTTALELFAGKRVGIELLNGETQATFERMMQLSEITGYTFVSNSEDPDVIVYWGTFYGERTRRYLKEGWYPYSFRENWVSFQALNEPAMSPFTLPSIPGNLSSKVLQTLTSSVLLVTHENAGDNAVYRLTGFLMKSKLELVHKDMMYRSLNEENVQRLNLLYPLHEGTFAYLHRDEPTFIERYADAIALVLSLLAIMYGAFQAIAASLARRKKEQLDRYFLDFMDIRSKNATDKEAQLTKLDALFHLAVSQMTNEKLEKSDFHILSRLIQQEIANIRVSR